MASLDKSQLSSLASAIGDLADRASEMATRLQASSDGDAVTALYEAERSLQMAGRHLERARRILDT